MTNLLANARLNEREWRNYARWNKDSFSRVLVADRDDYNMFLVAWERGNFSPVHDHAGSASWTKVLEGELDEAVYGVAPSGELRFERSGPMSAGVTYAHEGFIHGCVASTRCFTLQVYSPPYKSANAYDADGATTKIPDARARRPRRRRPLHGARVSRAPRPLTLPSVHHLMRVVPSSNDRFPLSARRKEHPQ